MEEVVLVDRNDKEVGTGEKMQTHKEGTLHRAFSIFVFNSEGKMLIHQRNRKKYTCAGLWTNTCCSHPRPGEKIVDAVNRRLKEEMGFTTELKKIFDFVYKVRFDNGLYEHEFDHVFIGRFDGKPHPNPDEVDDWKWVDPKELMQHMDENPDKYTYWFRQAIGRVIEYVEKQAQ